MTNEDPPEPARDGGLQFDRAESKVPETSSCAVCRAPIGDPFYLSGSKKLCASCGGGLQAHLSKGSAGGRFLLALILGGLAALLGGVIWAVITYKSEGTVYGIVAIGLGYIVGLAVRKGCSARGGRGYQLLAVALTYVGISIGYLGAALPELSKHKPAPAAEAKADPKVPQEGEKPPAPVPAPGCLVALVVVIGICLASPFMIAVESPITLFFLAIAFWEAWKLNRGVVIDLKGPFRTEAAGGRT